MADKKYNVWTTTYNNHKIKVTNNKKAVLYIDGHEVDKEKGVNMKCTLKAPVPDSDKMVLVLIKGEDQCSISFIEDARDVIRGYETENGEFVAYTKEELEELENDKTSKIVTDSVITTLLNTFFD